MDKQHAPPGGGLPRIALLLVSPEREDGLSLKRLLRHSGAGQPPFAKWSVIRRTTTAAAMAELKTVRIPIVFCDHDASAGRWKTLVDKFVHLANPPLLVVLSRVADERLWAEALNLGAWDVLAKPLAKSDVDRTLHSAWLQWCSRHSSVAVPSRTPLKAEACRRCLSATGSF